MKLKNLILVALLLIVPLSSSGSVKIRYPLNEWNTEPFWQSNTVTGPDGEIYNAPKDTAINSYFDHDGYGNKTAKNFSCTSGYPYDRHSGIDFRTGVLSTTSPGIFQTPVLAVAPGKVVLTEAYCDQTGYIGNGCGGGLGNHIVLEHDADTRTVYGSLIFSRRGDIRIAGCL
jgi:murein DD-endopeptidase MepM/ murein hydrolase activator NlpD